MILKEIFEYIVKIHLGFQVHLLTDFYLVKITSFILRLMVKSIRTDTILIKQEKFLISYTTWLIKKWNALVLNIFPLNGLNHANQTVSF